MEIRKVQKTGDMHYVYLPTSWCKKHNISSDSKVDLAENSSGALMIYPQHTKREIRPLEISIDEDEQDIINKLIMACYINPLSSFKIRLKKEMDASKLLQQKNIISLESVEIEKNVISSDSSVIHTDPDLLLKTMVKKIKNLVMIMAANYNKELVGRYEEEIDRTKILIEKSIINYMTMGSPPRLRMIDLYYISQLARDLERIVDHLIRLDDKDVDYIKQLEAIMQVLKENLDSLDLGKLGLESALEFLKKARKLKQAEEKDKMLYDKRRIQGLLLNISEVLIDWAVTNKIKELTI